jgi:processive 1,2-diacylglycerol beta-glucosyltransferase
MLLTKIMFKKIDLFLTIFLTFCVISQDLFSDNQIQKQSEVQAETPKKKIIILTSKGGYGHMAACQALTETLSDTYEIKVINPFEELLSDLDFVRSVTFKKTDGEGLYNTLLSSGSIGTANILIGNIAPGLVRSKRKKTEKRMLAFLAREKPDFLFSAIPFLNLPAGNVAHKLSIPFLIITLDGDTTNWALGLHKLQHKNFLITVGAPTKDTLSHFTRRGISGSRIKAVGFPIRKDFLEPKDPEKIRAEWLIPNDKFTIMVMMGGAGSTLLHTYAKKLTKMDINAHLLLCAGRNEKLAQKLKNLPCAPGISLTVIPFTKKVADLMAVSNLFITKPGPNSINEAIHMELPMLLDYTQKTLFWERANVTLVTDNQLGDVVGKLKHLEKLVKKYVNNSVHYAHIKAQMKNYSYRYFRSHIKPIITQLEQNQKNLTTTLLTD